MNLEDHLGDIVRKARLAANLTPDAAAKAAALNTAELAALEDSGQPPPALNYSALASLLALDARKLEGIARGWLPSPKDLGPWRELRVIATERGMAVNAYLVWDEVSRDAAVFDTGWDAAPLVKLIEENSLTLRHIFLTHSDEDHIAALEPLRARFPKAHLHTSSKNAPPQHRNRTNDFLHLGSLRITNRETPGHTEDGCIYIIGNWPEDAPHVGIIGDTIFAGSLARGKISTDLLRQKVREHIFTLPADTLLCPGHGPMTTVAEERANNPFF